MFSFASGSGSPPSVAVVPRNPFICFYAPIVLIVEKDVLPVFPVERYLNPDGVPAYLIFKEQDVCTAASFLNWKFLDVLLIIIPDGLIEFFRVLIRQELPTPALQRIGTSLRRAATGR